MSRDRTLTGVALMVGFCLTAPLIDVASKLAAATLPAGQITAARFVVQGALMLPVALALGHGLRLPLTLVPMLAWRGFLLAASTFAFVSAIAVMPIADALAIVFVEPFILLLWGRYVLGERVGPRRTAAAVVGFAGVLLVIQPSFERFGLIALWPLATAVSFAFYILVTRRLSAVMHPVPMQVHTSTMAVLFAVPPLLWAEGTGHPAFDAAMPAGLDWLWLFGVGLASAVSHLLMTYALRAASASVLAPLHYLELVSAVILGLVVFGDFPNAMALAGIAVVVGSGLYIIHRERITARARPPAGPLPPQAGPGAAGSPASAAHPPPASPAR